MNEFDSNNLSNMLRRKNEAYKAAVKTAEEAKQTEIKMRKASQEAQARARWEAKVAENELKKDKSAAAQASFLIFVFDAVMMLIIIGISAVITDIMQSMMPMVTAGLICIMTVPFVHLYLSCSIHERIYNKGKR